MDLKDIKKLAKTAVSMANNIPVAHLSYSTVYLAQDRIDSLITDFVAIEKVKAVREFIAGKDTEKRDSKDLSELAHCDRLIMAKQKRIDEAVKLKDELETIHKNYAIEQAAKNAGAVNHDLVCKVIKGLHDVRIDENGNATVHGKGGLTEGMLSNGQPLEEFVRDMARNPEYSMMFSTEKAHQESQNRQEPGYSGVNPFRKETFNLTEQGRLVRENRALAVRLKAEAEGNTGKAQNKNANPWKKETFNLTEQGQIVRKNPELAKRLAAQAGKTLNI